MVEEKRATPNDQQLDERNRPVEVYDAQTLFKQGNEIMIRHAGDIYRIRITRNGKLIMNK